MLPVAAVAGIAVPAGAVLRQVGEHRLAAGRLAAPQPALLPHPGQVGERERRLGGQPVLQRGLGAGDVQVPAESAAVIDQPGPGTGIPEQVVDQFREGDDPVRLPDRAQPGPEPIDRREIASGGRWTGRDLVFVEEDLERVWIGQVRGVDQVRGEQQGGDGVMSEKHIDS